MVAFGKVQISGFLLLVIDSKKTLHNLTDQKIQEN
jgi:hypothetical protein